MRQHGSKKAIWVGMVRKGMCQVLILSDRFMITVDHRSSILVIRCLDCFTIVLEMSFGSAHNCTIALKLKMSFGGTCAYS